MGSKQIVRAKRTDDAGVRKEICALKSFKHKIIPLMRDLMAFLTLKKAISHVYVIKKI